MRRNGSRAQGRLGAGAAASDQWRGDERTLPHSHPAAGFDRVPAVPLRARRPPQAQVGRRRLSRALVRQLLLPQEHPCDATSERVHRGRRHPSTLAAPRIRGRRAGGAGADSRRGGARAGPRSGRGDDAGDHDDASHRPAERGDGWRPCEARQGARSEEHEGRRSSRPNACQSTATYLRVRAT